MEILVELIKTKFLHRRILYLGTSYPGNGCNCLLWVLQFTSNPKLADHPLLASEIFLIQYIHIYYQ